MNRLLRHPLVDVALAAIRRNRLQTLLTMIGISMGVATVLAMMAVGAGARRAVEQQVRAAGLNQFARGGIIPLGQPKGRAGQRYCHDL